VKILERIRNGLLAVTMFCGMLIGTLLVFLILIDNETLWFTKITTMIFIILIFLFGYSDKKKEQEDKK
jgi:phosphotransferase system  glucose/maltose/N-acetylglucosamine-specific IIC component